MPATRDAQLSLLGDPPRYQGRDIPSVIRGSNADLIAAVAPLYLDGDVCDVTYGLGKWWTRFRPSSLVCHDLDPTRGDGVDFRALPEPDDTYDAVTYDPPYIALGGKSDHDLPTRFGLVPRSELVLDALIAAGLAECRRVLKPSGWLLVKCGDYTNGKGLALGHRRILDAADELGLVCHDLIVHHTGSGPLSVNVKEWRRARRHHSYLLVFKLRRGPRRKAAS